MASRANGKLNLNVNLGVEFECPRCHGSNLVLRHFGPYVYFPPDSDDGYEHYDMAGSAMARRELSPELINDLHEGDRFALVRVSCTTPGCNFAGPWRLLTGIGA